MEDLLALYGRLADLSGSGDLYTALAVDGRPNYRVAKDPQGNPTLLVAPEASCGTAAVSPLELRNLSFRPRCVCRVRVEGATESVESLAVLKCTTDDSMLREYFLRSLSGMVAALPDTPTEGDVAGAVGKLVELFRALEAPPRTSLQGLWGELFLMALAPKIRQAAAAWHADPSALHDFVAGRQRVEVKSSTGPHRSHPFRLEQLLPPQGTDVVIASFILEKGGKGISIAQLWEEVSGRHELTVGLRDRISQILALGLGRDWRKARRVAFDPDAASKGLRLYDAAVIPKVDPGLPVEVSEVRFRSELTDVPLLSRAEVVRRGSLFEAMFG
ncbi:MAG: PD-(D/E)XK motif protein [Pseudomonadota bacterium]|nr:PD-(D/E)XK motif protein [Pseudomonadota bacterium]